MSKIIQANAADETQVKDAARKEKNNRETELNDLRQILATESGRRFIWKQLSRAGIYKTSVEHSGSMTYFNEGRREFGLSILADVMEARPEAYLEMMKESKEN